MKNKYLKYISGIIIFYFIWLVCIPILASHATDYVLKKINCITITKPRITTSFLPNIKFKADDFKLLNPDSSVALEISKPKINLRILPLLILKVHLNSFESKNINASFQIKDKLYLGEYPLELPKSNKNFALKRLKISGLKINLKQNNSNHIFNGKNIYFKMGKHGKNFLIFNMNADMISGDTTSKLYFDINLPNNKNYKKSRFNIDICELDLSPFSKLAQDYTKTISGYEINTMHGLINLHSDNKKLYTGINGLNIEFKDKENSIIFPEKLYINSNYKIEKIT